MTAQVNLTSAPFNQVTLTEPYKEAMAQFESALDTCIAAWACGEDSVVLQNNLLELFGDMLFLYFKRSLIEQIGGSVIFTLEPVGDSYRTTVKMLRHKVPELSPQLDVASTPSPMEVPVQTLSPRAGTAAVVVKKAPRPMNCWIIFRDAMHKKLKAESPHLTVQQICKHLLTSGIFKTDYITATRCSELWRALSPADKKPWQLAAASAKEEHLRQNPDYKYSPRKPGEKKKRQSRKAKRAANNVNNTNFVDFQLPLNMTMPATGHVFELVPAEEPVSFNIGNVSFNDVTPIADPFDIMGYLPEDSMPTEVALHDAESFRHDRLAAEFGNALDMDGSFSWVGDEAFAFRAGADGNATLPSLYNDTY